MRRDAGLWGHGSHLAMHSARPRSGRYPFPRVPRATSIAPGPEPRGDGADLGLPWGFSQASDQLTLGRAVPTLAAQGARWVGKGGVVVEGGCTVYSGLTPRRPRGRGRQRKLRSQLRGLGTEQEIEETSWRWQCPG